MPGGSFQTGAFTGAAGALVDLLGLGRLQGFKAGFNGGLDGVTHLVPGAGDA